ncbi:glycosyltransferase family 4 protein [Neobacillus thermocopriae]|jgi:glycogen synthase|uniref:Glycosyltransferase family 4 protein n=3 Tax=Neobacillus thermocopriae TaxID=1215031 RepID=A0A6B3TTN9_9BACI|nr:glycosyltransferase family 4 protein [Neobacillus thermocopriae]MED3715558.1 glycosyltransferase family 4 protein [Neobacillus thermocopriae]NEX79676.1 glycosyltransferase family 4 protein [Neobacillus thermocopriae]
MPKLVAHQADTQSKLMEGWQLKILMLSWEYPPNIVGGLSKHVSSLAVQLAKLGHEIHVLTAGNRHLPSFEEINGVKVHRVTPLNYQDDCFLSWIGGLNLAMAFKAESLVKEFTFDLIHAHDWLVGAAALVLKDVLSIPLLSTIHATEHGRNNGIYTEMQKFIHEKERDLIIGSDQLIVCSQYMKEQLLTVFQATEENIIIIPNGVEPPETFLKIEDWIPKLKNKKYIFSIGRMVKEKGFETIIEAAALAKEQGFDYTFIIAGKGPMLDTFRRVTVERGLENHVSFIGYITEEQKNALISGCMAAVFPSLYEPFGIVALETLIQGKPTIVANTGGLKGIIKHLQTGLLMNPGDEKSLLEQIHFLSKHLHIANQIGAKGMEMVESLYRWNRIAADTSRVMEDTVLNSRIKER